RAAVDEQVYRLERDCVRPLIHRHQIYMELEPTWLAPFERLPELRRAGREDYAMVFESGARLRAEELEEDPRRADAAGYARRTEDEGRDGYTHIWSATDGPPVRARRSAGAP